MQDPILRSIYQPLVNATGIDPENGGRVAIDVYVPMTVFLCWLEWQLDPNPINLMISLFFLYVTRVRFWPVIRNGMRAAMSDHAMIHLMYRVCIVGLVAFRSSQIAHGLATGAEGASVAHHVVQTICLVLLASAIYLPMCDAPPPRRRDDRRRAYAGG